MELDLAVESAPDDPVWRVGFAPDPWAWVDWKWAEDGRFHGRWDDESGNFRTLYAGESLLACLLEVLSPFRIDTYLADELARVEVDPADEAEFPTQPAGQVDISWLTPRRAGSANLRGQFCAVTDARSVAALWPHFVADALRLGRLDFDVAVLKDGSARSLTQSVSTYLYGATDCDGLAFASRLGDELGLWVLYERPGDAEVSRRLNSRRVMDLDANWPEFRQAFALLGLTWSPALEPDGATTPLPLVRSTEAPEVLARRYFGDQGITPATPLGAAILWQLLLADPAGNRLELEALSSEPAAWQDFAEAAAIMAGVSVLTSPIVDATRPNDLAHIKFVPYAGERGAQVVEAAPLPEVWILTLTLDRRSGWWRATKLSYNRVPSAHEVLGRNG